MQSALIVLLTVTVCLLVVLIGLIAIMVRRLGTPVNIKLDFSHPLEYIAEAIGHHAEVHSVLAHAKSFTDNPELLENLAGYSRQVVAAALLHRTNYLASNLKAIREQLAALRGQQLSTSLDSRAKLIAEGEALEKQLMQELDAANLAVQEFTAQKPDAT